MNYILKLLNINRTYILIISVLFFLVSSFNKTEKKSFTIKDAFLSFTPTALIIEKVASIRSNEDNLLEESKLKNSEDFLSDNNSVKSNFIL